MHTQKRDLQAHLKTN